MQGVRDSQAVVKEEGEKSESERKEEGQTEGTLAQRH